MSDDSKQGDPLSGEQLHRFIHRLVSLTDQDAHFSGSLSVLDGFIHSFNSNTIHIFKYNDNEFSYSDDLSFVDLKDGLKSIMILVKYPGQILESKNIGEQINVINIPLHFLEDGHNKNEAIESMRSIISLGMTPYLDLIAAKTDDNSNSVNITRKKLHELTLSLQHMQQRIQIPSLLNTTHPRVLEIISKDIPIGSEILEDSVFLNELTQIVNGWIKQIQQVTSLSHDPIDGSSINDEIQFWRSMELALDSIEKQTQTKELLTSIEILNHAKRFHVTLSFNNNTGLSNKQAITKLYNSLLKDLPIDELMTVSWNDKKCMNRLEDAIVNMFNHIKKVKNLSSFPLARVISITELILNDIIGKLCHILSNGSLLSMPLDEFFDVCNNQIKVILGTIEQNIKNVINLIRELLRKRHEKFMVIKINHELLDDIAERIEHLYGFRIRHQQLLLNLERILSIESRNELADCYNKFLLTLNPFEPTKQAKALWENNEKHYLIVYKRMETSLIEKLNSIFNACYTLNDFISVLKKYDRTMTTTENNYNHLVSLISDEYKIRIMSMISKELEQFGNLKIKGRHQSMMKHINSLERIAPDWSEDNIVHQIVFNFNFRNKMLFYHDTLTYLLGQNWNKYAIGYQIDTKITAFLKALDSNKLFNTWLESLSSYFSEDKISILTGPIMKIIDSDKKDLIVNFDFRLLDSVHEMKLLYDLGFKIPINVSIKINKIDKIYAFVVNLFQQVSTLKRICHENYTSPDGSEIYEFLMSDNKSDTFGSLKKILDIEWGTLSKALDLQQLNEEESNIARQSVIEFEALSSISEFETNVRELYNQVNKFKEFDRYLKIAYNNIRSCNCDERIVKDLIGLIHRATDSLTQESHPKFSDLTRKIKTELSCILFERCTEFLNIVRSFVNTGDSSLIDESMNLKTIDFFKSQTHRIVLEDQKFKFLPPLESTTKKLFLVMNEVVSIFCSEFDHLMRKDFRGDNGQELENLDQCIASITLDFNLLLTRCKGYLNEWKKLQNLWELSTSDRMGEFISLDANLDEWIVALSKVMKSRKIFEAQDSWKSSFIVVDCSGVRSVVSSKFDAFQNEIIDRFAKKLQNECNELMMTFAKSREALQSKLVLGSGSWDFIDNVELYCIAKNSLFSWESTTIKYKECQSLLIRLRFAFPKSWTHVEQLENELSLVKSLLDHKASRIDSNTEILISRVRYFNSRLLEEMSLKKKEWTIKRPVQGNLKPAQALSALSETRESFDILNKRSKSILRISETFSCDFKLTEPIENEVKELDDLKLVWSYINSVWEDLEDLKLLQWEDVHPRRLRYHLDDMLNKLKGFPIKVKQYTAFGDIQSSIKSYASCSPLIYELKNDAMKARHWKRLVSELSPQNKFDKSWTLGDVWNLNLMLNENLVKFVVERANNEKLIEDKLTQIKRDWHLTSFEIFNYKNKCRLVKNWEHLTDKCDNDLNVIESMKSSPYYSSFENEVLESESSLQNLYSIFDSWIDVQRQWIYLEGIFGSHSSELRSLLPVEYTRFTNITFEFTNLLSRIYKYDTVYDILNLPDMQDIMKKCNDGLIKTRKSLSNYLEKQRDSFPRFYFVGNEDLLELIGGSNDEERINKHLRKMYTGISGVDYDQESCSIVSINSEQGERLKLQNPISLIKYSSLIDWLTALEEEMSDTLSFYLKNGTESLKNLIASDEMDESHLRDILNELPFQIVILSFQVIFTSNVDNAIKGDSPYGDGFKSLLNSTETLIRAFTNLLGLNLTTVMRKKIEGLIIETLHHRDISNQLCLTMDSGQAEHIWHLKMRYYYDRDELNVHQAVKIVHSSFETYYGFEYLGITEKLAYTPLTNDCFLAMSLALNQKLGGSPFGPAGTGKTETIKALGSNLGKMVLVFCCDDSFDFSSMGRLLLGLCRVGCWGCFDEFNRLDEKILSAVSSQIEKIELNLSQIERFVNISDKRVNVNRNTGIFVTMNPGYVGRSELPENLKKLFRAFSMDKPNLHNIVEVLLTSQTFKHSKNLASKVVPFFKELANNTSSQAHYDFGLRAIKSALVKCGAIKRSLASDHFGRPEDEFSILLQSIRETVAPKLITSDVEHFKELVDKYFSGISSSYSDYGFFENRFKEMSLNSGLIASNDFVCKALQLFQLQETHHGIMLVGESGSGKTTVWKNVLKTISSIKNQDHHFYILDCKVMTKARIYGSLDSVTRDWTDGVFTSILRKIMSNLRGELGKPTWIIFDGDIDPEWAENLNSVLDDNKLFTLPNGERLDIPDNVRIIFEVDSLKFTTPATISRCGMIWFDRSIVSHEMLIEKSFITIDERLTSNTEEKFSNSPLAVELRTRILRRLKDILNSNTIHRTLTVAQESSHIMAFTIERGLSSFIAIFCAHVNRYLEFIRNGSHLEDKTEDIFIRKTILLSLIWAFMGDSSLQERENFSSDIFNFEVFSTLVKPENGQVCINFDVLPSDGSWQYLGTMVDDVELEPHQILQPNTVIPTMDTVMHEQLIYFVLNEHRSLVLCGPPGSGKTMTLIEALRKSPHLDIISLNFSKDTSPNYLIKSLEQHCEYSRSSSGSVLKPRNSGKWVVVFCDEINLPSRDKYGTQRVISLMRQMIEHGGFWSEKSCEWVSLVSIQIVGACNPPTDPGRHMLSKRFLRHVSVLMIDYPGQTSLQRIYSTIINATMKCAPNLRGFADMIASSMIYVYTKTKEKLTSDIQAHYIYSPRELSRWAKGIFGVLRCSEYHDLSQFVRLWYHEGLRLFYDRLVGDSEREWTIDLFKLAIQHHFPNVDTSKALSGPILYSNWLNQSYESVDVTELRPFVNERLKVFSEEEFDLNLVLYEDLLDHSLRVDRVLRQAQGHLILVGPCTSGKTTIVRFVAWMNGLKLRQLSVNSSYTLQDFDNTLREILLSCAKGEKMCFLIDEANILETAFIERMNTLLANSEIPGLFEGDNQQQLISICSDQSVSQGIILDTENELLDWFRDQICQNLHVVFNISETDNSNNPEVLSSPALFNRCVLSWMGNWNNESLQSIGASLIEAVPLDLSDYTAPINFQGMFKHGVNGLKDIVIDTFVYIHRNFTVFRTVGNMKGVPGDFMSLLNYFVQVFRRKDEETEENQLHITTGLDKLREAVIQVNQLNKELSSKKEFLSEKNDQARIMLNQMLSGQNEAERKQEFSIATQAELEKQEKEIEKRRALVMKDLSLAEPAVLEAQRGVQNIKKQHLTEIRSMMNPPNPVKLTMESVCILLGYKVSSWRDVQLIIRRDDFIANIVSFSNQGQITSELLDYMNDTYTAREDYNFQTVYRASKACGPLLQWVQAQLNFSTILGKIEPLRNEVVSLETQTKKTRAQLIAIDQMIRELQESIERYKEDYSSLIRDAENTKSEMRVVESKINRSMSLIDDLTTERERWKSSTHEFKEKKSCIVGNSILSSVFLVFLGGYDQKKRLEIIDRIKKRLNKAAIKFDNDLSFYTYLNSPGDILRWRAINESSDQLLFENITLMNRAKFPLIIDPSSKFIDVLSHIVPPKRLVITSFLSSGYMKHLENCLRFGGHILIQDAEYYDPALNALLRFDIRKNAGRMTVKVGESDVDLSPDFKLYLHVKDSTLRVPSSVAARTTSVNFTITEGTLEDEVLNTTLKKVRPDIDAKRGEMIALQSEYSHLLFNLEDDLLRLLNDSSGNILENDSLLRTLEKLKAESTEIDMKMGNCKNVMEDVSRIRSEYDELATHSSSIFGFIKQIGQLGKFYKFSLDYFMSILRAIMAHSTKEEVDKHILIERLYQEVFAITALSLSYKDRIVFAMLLFVSFHSSTNGTIFSDLMIILMKLVHNDEVATLSDLLDLALARYNKSKGVDNISFEALMAENQDNDNLVALSDIIRLVMSPGLGTDTLLSTFASTCSSFMGIGSWSSKYDLSFWLDDEFTSTSLLILVSPEGFDATTKIERLCNSLGRKLNVLSMGSAEGGDSANRELENAAVNGEMILLQNVQMSPEWLSLLDIKLEQLEINPGFRIFLTCSITSDMPPSLINRGKVFVFEGSSGLKYTLKETLKSINPLSLEQVPKELVEMVFILVWFHSTILERLKFCPVSFAKAYDINDSDFNTSFSIIESIYKQLISKGTFNKSKIPWSQMAYLIGRITYGGKIDDKKDLDYVMKLANYLFSPDVFDKDFNLIKNDLTEKQNLSISPPECDGLESLLEWADKIPEDIPLCWIGLEEQVHDIVRRRQGLQVTRDLLDVLSD